MPRTASLFALLNGGADDLDDTSLFDLGESIVEYSAFSGVFCFLMWSCSHKYKIISNAGVSHTCAYVYSNSFLHFFFVLRYSLMYISTRSKNFIVTSY